MDRGWESVRADARVWSAGLSELHARFVHRFSRVEAQESALAYMRGLSAVGAEERLDAGGGGGAWRPGPDPNRIGWDAGEVLDYDYVVEHLGDPDAVLVDDTGFPKKGVCSAAIILPATRRSRRTYAPRGRTPLLRHRLNWKRASMAGALGYHSTDPDRGVRVFSPQARQLRHRRLIEVLEQMKMFYRGERLALVWGGLSAHWSPAMRAWGTEQDWLTME